MSTFRSKNILLQHTSSCPEVKITIQNNYIQLNYTYQRVDESMVCSFSFWSPVTQSSFVPTNTNLRLNIILTVKYLCSLASSCSRLISKFHDGRLGKSSSFKKKSSTAISSPGADTGLIDLRAASFRLSISASVSRWKCKAYL